MVCVLWNDEVVIKKVFDIGASGVVVLLVNIVEDVRLAVGCCKYLLIGFRSVGIMRV